MQLDEKFFKICFYMDKLYANQKLGVKAFNNYLKQQDFATTIKMYIKKDMQIESLEDLPSLQLWISLIMKFDKLLDELFSVNYRFATNISDTLDWNNNDSNLKDCEDVISEVLFEIRKKSSIFTDYKQIKNLIELWVKFDQSFPAINNSNFHFITNIDFNKDMKTSFLTKNVDVIHNLDIDLLRKHINFYDMNNIKISNNAFSQFIITKSKYVELINRQNRS